MSPWQFVLHQQALEEIDLSQKTISLIQAAVVESKDPALIGDKNGDYYMAKAVPVRGVVALVAAHAVLYVILALIICSVRPGSPEKA